VNYLKVSDFISDFNYETEATIKMFKNLTDVSLKQKVTENGRSLGRLAWHITGSFGEMGTTAGLTALHNVDDKIVPIEATVIVDEYMKATDALKNAVTKEWKDASFKDEINMYGQTWTKGQTLSVLLVHQMHHRGQMTVLMRQAGLKVPGVYGPAFEEWSDIGMSPQE
jgi:uncharacterized damage-inducible protein DinB